MSTLSARERFRLYRRDLRHPWEMVRRFLGLPSRRREKVATSLRFLHEVLGLERFHYGLWEDEPRTLAGLRAAQARYSATLLGWIPEGVASVLDVGCGVGLDAQELAWRGLDVEGLAPDPYQRERFEERTGLPFHLARFQDFEPRRTWDLVLMSESAQYIWPQRLFAKVHEAAPGGWLLVADYFTVGGGASQLGSSGHALEEFRRRAAEAGFLLERERDVTAETAPTLDLFAGWWERYVEPSLAIAADSLEFRTPRLFRLARRLFGRRLVRQLERNRQMTGDEFRRTKRYLLMLWKVPAA